MSKNISIKDVLAVVDGTPASLTGVDQAVAYAGLYDATLAIVVVTENLAWAAAVDPMAYAEAMEAPSAKSMSRRFASVSQARRFTSRSMRCSKRLAFSPGLPRRKGSMQISSSSPEQGAGRAMACVATSPRRSCSRACPQW